MPSKPSVPFQVLGTVLRYPHSAMGREGYQPLLASGSAEQHLWLCMDLSIHHLPGGRLTLLNRTLGPRDGRWLGWKISKLPDTLTA